QAAGAILPLANDLLDLLEHAKTERQPGIDAGGLLPQHAGAQHQPMRHDLRLLRILFQDRQKEPRHAHGQTLGIGWVGNLATAVKPDRSPKYKKDVRRSRQAVGFSAFFRVWHPAPALSSVPVLTFVSYRDGFAYECQNQRGTSKC